MRNFPEPQNDPPVDHADVRADAGLIALPEGISQACLMGDEVGDTALLPTTPSLTPAAMVSRDALQPRAGLPAEGVSEPPVAGPPEALREVLSDAGRQRVAEAIWKGLWDAFPNGGDALPLRAPSSETRFEAAPYPTLPPIVDLSALPSRSPPQIALAHRPWEHSTGPRSEEGKKQAARNGKSCQIGVLSVRELRQYKKEQKSLLESLDRTLILAREINRLLELATGEVQEQSFCIR